MIVHWYTYRTIVGALLGTGLALVMIGLYTQEQSCNLGAPTCVVSLRVHPEDRLFPRNDPPNPEVVIVGIDDASIQAIGAFPFSRDKYATLLDNLVADGAAVVVFDVGFSEERAGEGDELFQRALVNAHIPVVLAYGQCDQCTDYGDHKLKLKNADQIPIRKFRCLDANSDPFAPCRQPIENVDIGSTTVELGGDAILRTMPMFVEPACHTKGACDIAMLNPISFVAYRDFFAPGSETDLEYVPGEGATFGQAWTRPLYVDDYGMAIVNWSGAPGNIANHHQYQSFIDVFNDKTPRNAIDGKIVLVGAYGATGIRDAEPVPTSDGAPMAGVEIHANLLTELLSPQQKKFTYAEPGWLVMLTLLALCTGLGALLARMSLLKGAAVIVVAMVAYTLPWAMLQNVPVPDLVHPWLGIALTYTGLTAYRFLYEGRERRKVTAIFGQYLKPEIVDQLAAKRSLDDIAVGGQRRELSVLFVDIRGFTSMSEAMPAEDVLKVLDEYLGDLTQIIFKWDGTLDKYVGDEIMAAWNAVDDQPAHALYAIHCAYEMLAHGRELNRKLVAKGLPEIRYGVGVNTGLAVWGNMGSPYRRQFTAIGDTVNTAARFCSVAGPFELLVGDPTYQAVKDHLTVELAPGIQLKGKSAETFKIFRAVAIRPDAQSPWLPFPTYAGTATDRS